MSKRDQEGLDRDFVLRISRFAIRDEPEQPPSFRIPVRFAASAQWHNLEAYSSTWMRFGMSGWAGVVCGRLARILLISLYSPMYLLCVLIDDALHVQEVRLRHCKHLHGITFHWYDRNDRVLHTIR